MYDNVFLFAFVLVYVNLQRSMTYYAPGAQQVRPAGKWWPRKLAAQWPSSSTGWVPGPRGSPWSRSPAPASKSRNRTSLGCCSARSADGRISELKYASANLTAQKCRTTKHVTFSERGVV